MGRILEQDKVRLDTAWSRIRLGSGVGLYKLCIIVK